MNNFLVKFSLYLDIVKKGRGLTKIKIIPGTFKILTQCLPGIQNKFSSMITIFHLKYFWKWVGFYCIYLKRKKILTINTFTKWFIKKKFYSWHCTVSLHIRFYELAFFLWQKVYSVAEKLFNEENFFSGRSGFLRQKIRIKVVL